MTIEKTSWAIDRDHFSDVVNFVAPDWEPFDAPSMIQKGAIALSLQWYKATSLDAIERNLAEEGGAEMMARTFAVGLLNHLEGYVSRMDLNQVALAFLLELERRNQETPNPRNCDDIASAVERIQSQFGREQGPSVDLPRWRDELRIVDPSLTPHITLKAGERFQIEMPVHVSDGYGWWNLDVSTGSVGIVSRHNRNLTSHNEGLKTINTIFTLQGLHEGACRIKFTLNISGQEKRLAQEVWLSVSVFNGEG
jgi:hypothetical protein